MEFVIVMDDKKKTQFNNQNERAKYKYRQHLRRVCQKDEKTILAALKHIRDFDIFIDFASFEKFNEHVADKYIQGMFTANLSLSYILDNVRTLKEFLKWLERQNCYRSKINYNHIDYLNISRNQRNTAKATEYSKSYKFEEIIQTIRQMPNETEKEKRNRAIISLQAVCALRPGELRTVKMKSLIKEDGVYFIYVSPKDMAVKFAKTRHVNFVPLPGDIITNIIHWRDYLMTLGFKGADPLFPKIDNRLVSNDLLKQTIRKEGIKSETELLFVKAINIAQAFNQRKLILRVHPVLNINNIKNYFIKKMKVPSNIEW